MQITNGVNFAGVPQSQQANKNIFGHTIGNLIESNEKAKKLENTPIMGSCLDFDSFSEKFSDEDVEKINTSRQLPDGYILIKTPKVISHLYRDGVYMGDSVTRPSYKLFNTKKKQLPTWLGNTKTTLSDKLPDGYKIMNDKKRSYIVRNEETPESLKSKQGKVKKALSAIGTVMLGVVSFVGIKKFLGK